MQYDFHEYANLFPFIEGEDFAALVADIAKFGVREPLWLYEGKILDGRNRYRAAVSAGVSFNTKDFIGNDDMALAFVISLNLHRRQLSSGQRAVLALCIEEVEAERAKSRQLAAGASGALGGRGNKAEKTLPERIPEGFERSEAREKAAAAVGTNPRYVSDAKRLKREAPDVLKAVEAGKISIPSAKAVAELPADRRMDILSKAEEDISAAIRAAKAEIAREARVAKINEIANDNAPLNLTQRYPVIYADPPWRYEHSETNSRAIENQYPTMSLDEICALPVAELATEDAILFMWTTAPKLEESMRVIREWGFNYRSCAIWDKQKIGMGYYFRIQHEILMIATRGSIPTPEPANRPRSVLSVASGKHSAKPHDYYDIINAMYPEFPKIELFCRSPQPGWAVWGNQSGSEAA